MAGVDDRRYDVKDILDKATTGWVAPPTKPLLTVEDVNNNWEGALGRMVTNGEIFIKNDYYFHRNKLCSTYEDRVWEFPIAIIGQSSILLQGMFNQTREVFDRYTSSPWSTSTLGTSTTYNYAGIERATKDPRLPKYVMECRVFLAEYGVAVVIA